ncbi:ATP-binding protein, partial [bacterium]|nr:ATP-binding protein [bacterium]
ISNLLDNALKYSPENSPVELQLEDEPTLVRFSVRDHGPGLGQDTQRKLFLAFERANTDARASGLGLGLFICRGIVNLHGGNIGVKSKLGSGSTFYFELPKKQPMRKTGS